MLLQFYVKHKDLLVRGNCNFLKECRLKRYVYEQDWYRCNNGTSKCLGILVIVIHCRRRILHVYEQPLLQKWHIIQGWRKTKYLAWEDMNKIFLSGRYSVKMVYSHLCLIRNERLILYIRLKLNFLLFGNLIKLHRLHFGLLAKTVVFSILLCYLWARECCHCRCT